MSDEHERLRAVVIAENLAKTSRVERSCEAVVVNQAIREFEAIRNDLRGLFCALEWARNDAIGLEVEIGHAFRLALHAFHALGGERPFLVGTLPFVALGGYAVPQEIQLHTRQFIPMNDINERLRLPSPAPKPLGLAFDGGTLWMASRETHRLYAIDAATWTVNDEAQAPGGPFGMTIVGDDLRVVIGFGENDHDRYICNFVPGRGFKNDRIPCPDLTGAHLAFDGDELFLSQAAYRRILALDGDGNVTREISLDRTPLGMVIVEGRFHLITSDEEFENLHHTVVDARGEVPRFEALASIPFDARGLTFDGSQFWTSHRDENQIVTFT